MTKRSYGTGSLFTHRDSWYGQWRVGGQLVKRKVGPKRPPGTREGLTRRQAEAELRRLMLDVALPTPMERVTLNHAGQRYLRHLGTLGRKPTTMADYESILRVHLAPFFDKPIAKIVPADIEDYIALKARDGQGVKTTLNQLGLLHSIFAFAEKKGWAHDNPCRRVDKPQKPNGNRDIRYLEQSELETLLVSAKNGAVGMTDRTLWLTAAMTGCRQGECLALRWRDIDWTAGRVRVRQNYVRGRFGTPKSRRSSRSVPLADRLAGELERHFQRSNFQADDDLVFCNPGSRAPLDASKLRIRFKDALRRAGVRPIRFHDLRHTFGTRMAAAGVPMRTLQEWMGHRDFATTLIYADYQPSDREAELVERAFGLAVPERVPT